MTELGLLRTLFRVQEPDSVRRRVFYGIVAFLAALVLVDAAVFEVVRAALPEVLARRVVAATPQATPSAAPTSRAAPPIGVAATPTPARTPTPTAGTPSTPSAAAPAGQIAALSSGLPADSVSVAARNLNTGSTFTYGSSGGQITASVVKVDILETLLLQLQTSGGGLSDDQQTEATSMIEDSDDDAASDLWEDIGGGSAMAAANQQLGVPCTVPGSGADWGLTTTCAQGQVQILDQLEAGSSPLDPDSRAYILNLMENVTPDQAWGVPAVADAGTGFAVKNGWLNMNGDSDWAITSDGIVTYQGQTLLIAALTQNNDTMSDGVALVQQLAQVAAQSVAP